MRRLIAALLMLIATPLAAQNMFAPVAEVGDRVVTAWELEQRVAFNRVLGVPGDVEATSLEQLVEDRLRLIASEQAGIRPTEDEIGEGMAEFAARADLTTDEFIATIAEAGVAEETFRDFVRAGLGFRQLVRGRFGRQVDVTEADVDRALARVRPPGRVEASLSEIILPANTPENRAQALAIVDEIGRSRSIEEFAAIARQVSFAATRDDGGRLDSLPLDRLPPPVREQLDALEVGGITEPIEIPDAIVLFQLRGIREVVGTPEAPDVIDYAVLYLAGGRSPETLAEAAGIAAGVDTCDDLYGVARGLPPEQLERGPRPLSQIPADVAAQLALLDRNEVSVALTRSGGETLAFLMLCERDPAPEEDEAPLGLGLAEEEDEVAEAEEEGAARPSRSQVRSRLRASRLAAYAELYLAELRAEQGVTLLR